MSSRFLLFATAALFATQARAADPPAAKGKPRPTFIVQTQPAGKLLADVQDILKLTGGPEKGVTTLKQFKKEVEDLLGEKGFEGLDLNRPVAGYATIREVGPDSSIVLVIPVTTEKEFLGLLDRLKCTVEEVAGKKGLYTFAFENKDLFPHDSYLRFAAGWAYIGLNSDEVVDTANLVPVAELTNQSPDAQIVARCYPDRFPKELMQRGLMQFEGGVNSARQFFVPQGDKAIGTLFDEGLKHLKRTAEELQRDGREVTMRYSFDPVTGMSQEFVVVPKPDTELAKAIATRRPTTNRFAELVGKDTVVGLVGQPPLFAAETQEMAGALFEMLGRKAAAEESEVPEPVRPLLVAACKGLARTVKSGDTDFAVALVGPDKAGRFTAVGAILFDDPSEVEKQLRAIVDQNGLFKKVVKLDVDKLDGVSLHTLALGGIANVNFAKVFGADAELSVGFGKTAVYAAIAPAGSAVAAVKAAVGVKAGPAPALELAANPARITKLVTALAGEPAGKRMAAILGTEDKRISAWEVTVSGGEKLTIRMVDRTRFFLQRALRDGLMEEPSTTAR